jgi:23S rRNA pseudouridine1911/1915/1917 synthase
MSEPTQITVEVADRADKALARAFPDAGRRQLSELFEEGCVKLKTRVLRKGDRVVPGEVITLSRSPISRDALRPVPDPEAAGKLGILVERADAIAIDKPAGMPSQPLRAGELGTAASGIVARFPECAAVADDPRDGGLVHRLDIGTSGALIAARTRAGWQRLRAAFAAGQVDKRYLALTEAAPIGRGCDEPLAQRGKKVAVDHADGLPASTTWEVERALGERRLVRCHASTGRMHQIRAHLALCGAPIVGDVLYGGQPFPGLVEFFLHAAEVRFPDSRGRPLAIVAPLPADRQAVLDALAS